MIKSNYSYKINNELIKLLYRQIRVALWAESTAAIFLALALWPVANHVVLIYWLLTNLFFCGIARHYIVYKFNQSIAKSEHSNPNYSYWLILFSIGAIISGSSWGISGSLLLIKDNLVIQTFQVFLLLGVTAAANPFYSPYRYVYALFLIPAFLPFAVWLILQGDIFITLGCLAIIYMIILLATSYYSHKLIVESLKLRFDNLQLFSDLSLATVSLEDKTHDTEKSLSLLKATLDATTNGILVIDSLNKVTTYNQKFIEMWQIPISLHINNESELMNYMSQQIMEPYAFVSKLKYEESSIYYESSDEIKFNDGRIFELHSQPQTIGNKYVGRVFSFRDITARKTLESKLYHQANHDSLTGLPNRSLAFDRLSQAIISATRENLHVAVLFIDIDRFK